MHLCAGETSLSVGSVKSLCLSALVLLLAAISGHSVEPAASPTATATASAVQDLSPEEAAALLQKKPQVVILDVRTPDEFADGHLEGARNLSLLGGTFEKELPKLDPSKEYLVHCAAGTRSAKALTKLKAANFQHVYHLPSGFNGWKNAQKPVVTGP